MAPLSPEAIEYVNVVDCKKWVIYCDFIVTQQPLCIVHTYDMGLQPLITSAPKYFSFSSLLHY